jgi:hypothetical protein
MKKARSDTMFSEEVIKLGFHMSTSPAETPKESGRHHGCNPHCWCGYQRRDRRYDPPAHGTGFGCDSVGGPINGTLQDLLEGVFVYQSDGFEGTEFDNNLIFNSLKIMVAKMVANPLLKQNSPVRKPG